jgi:oligopeptide transport system substrate-binding protein
VSIYRFFFHFSRALVLTALLCHCTRKREDVEGTVYLHARASIRSLDPAHASDIYSQRTVLQIYEGLLHFHYLKRPLELEPLLAEALPTVSADRKTITFKIKKGIFFQDDPAFPGGKGRELVANDFIYSWKRLADVNNKGENYWIFRDKVVGYEEWRTKQVEQKTDYTLPVEGLMSPDPYTLVIQLKEPQAELLYLLATAATAVVAQEVVEHYGEEFPSHPVGTGAFSLESWSKNSKITLVKSKNYRKSWYPEDGTPEDKKAGLLEDAGQLLPRAQKIVVQEISEEQPQWLLFEKGDLDVWQTTKDYQSQFLINGKLSPEHQKRGIQLQLPVSADITYVGFNTENTFLRNKKVRQAMALAYDQSLLLKQFYNQLVVRAHGPIPPNVEGYREKIKNSYLSVDLERAKKLLDEAGFPEGKGLPEFVFEMPSTNTTSRQMGEFFKQRMLLIGIRIKLQPNTWSQFNEKIKNKQADIFEMAWNGDYPDAENFLQLFYSKKISPGPNSSNFNNSEFDALYEKAKKTLDDKEKIRLYQKMEDLLMEEMPWIFNFHRVLVIVTQPWMRNYKHEAMITDAFKYYSVDTQLREATKKQQPSKEP